MHSIGWPSSPLLVPDATSTFTIASGTRPRSITLTDVEGKELSTARLTSSDLAVGLLSTPRHTDWGTIFSVVKAPSLASGPAPIAQRAGATLWFSHGHIESADGHAVEWVEPGEWYLVASHVTTERVWWDIVGWGSGWGSTVDAPIRTGIKDNGLTLIAVDEPLVVASMEFYDRTFGHDEVMSLADNRSLGLEPTLRWDLFDESLDVFGSREPSLSWNATSARSKKRAISVLPRRGNVWQAEAKVAVGTTNVLIARSGDGFVLSAATPVAAHRETIVSLMNTPYPSDEDDLP
jgi:hypothetical protein